MDVVQDQLETPQSGSWRPWASLNRPSLIAEEESVDIKSLDELREVDERVLAFAPLEVALRGRMRPEDAALYQQEAISHADLVPAVGERTRTTFERLRTLYAYGVLCYDLFTIVEDQAHLVMEFALRERFLAFYEGVVPMEDAEGNPHPVQATRVDDLFEQIRKGSRLRGPQRRQLRLRRTSEVLPFDGMLNSLLRWARGEGLLRGQQNRRLEPLLKAFRNHVAHGAGDHLDMPADAARTLSDLAEIINQLWGSDTPGGRLYPAPIRREVQVIAWNPVGRLLSGPANDLPPEPEYKDWTCVLVRAVLHDQGLRRFDAQYETTMYPCGLLWGPGAWQDASAWLKKEQPEPDEVEILDRIFLLQHHENRLYLPRCPDIAAGLPAGERGGQWHLTRADFPHDASRHTSQVLLRGPACSGEGPCQQCAAETLGSGTWQEMLDLATASGTTLRPRAAPDIRAPSLMSQPRYEVIRANQEPG